MKIGFTTSFPIESFLAAGYEVIDLNNVFINGNSQELVEAAEYKGYPRNVCAWIKGMYSLILESDYDYILGVLEGDCSNTHSLLSTLKDAGQKVQHFSFPFDQDRQKLDNEISILESFCGVTREQTEAKKAELDEIRRGLIELDELTWKEGKVSGAENHKWLVSSSDFNGNPEVYKRELDIFLSSARKRNGDRSGLRLGYLGVPPIITNLYEFLEEANAKIVYNEIQRQFAMPFLTKNIIDQYLQYTYPYSIFKRLEDIQREIKLRKLDGLISYAQSFCHRQIDNILIRKYAGIPVLNLEGDKPGELDERTILRLESFIDMLEIQDI